MRRDLAVSVLLFVATLAVYGQVVEHEFMYFDDDLYIYENPHVMKGITWDGVGWAFTSMWTSNWHPLTWLSHMVDCALFGLNAGYHHLVNVLLHIVNSVLLYLVLKRMTGAVWRSAMVAALFALHPLHVESVAWAAERKDVLSALFFMLTLWIYERYAARPGWSRYGLVFGVLALGLMAKPMLVTVPFVLLLLDYWPLARFRFLEKVEPKRPKERPQRREDNPERVALRLVSEKAPLFFLILASSVVTFVAQHRGGAVASTTIVPIGNRIANALIAYVSYVGKMLWPTRLAVFYPPRYEFSTPQWASAALILVGISVLVLWARRRWPYLLVGWFWYLGMLVPVIGLVQVGQQSMADRYTYLPMVGLFLLVAWGGTDLAARWQHRRVILGTLAGIVLLGCLVGTKSQVGYWKTGPTLLRHSLKVTKSNALAHNNLAAALMAEGKTDEGITHFREALRIDPQDGAAHNNLGIALMEKGRLEEAIPHYLTSLRIDPEQPAVHTNLGLALASQGKAAEAITHYQEALRIRPDDPRPYNNLAWIRATHPDPRFRDGAEAVELAEKACELWGYREPIFLGTLAAAYAEAGRFTEAVGTVRQAIAIAMSAGRKELASELQERRQGYEAGRPYREGEATGGDGDG
jgi:Flp pilus assembly protein TadD